MVEWWSKAHELIMEEELTVEKISQAVYQSNCKLRNGFEMIIKTCRERDIPLLIFSAGLGDIIEQVLLQCPCCHIDVQGKDSKWCSIYSNLMINPKKKAKQNWTMLKYRFKI